MRIVQIVLFSIGVLSFIVSAFFIGYETGDTLWKIGVAAILVDLACSRLWPTVKNA